MFLSPVSTAVLALTLALSIASCAAEEPPAAPGAAVPVTEIPAAEVPIRRAIERHGMDVFDSAYVAFTFRDRDYSISRQGGSFAYTRTFSDSSDRQIEDVLTNAGLTRTVDDQGQVLSDSVRLAYSESVNSVRYFFMLPYGLLDPAAKFELLDEATIGASVYDRVRVTFREEGGGVDSDDVYHYFFNRESGLLDYLAYSFRVNDGGIRFREAINRREVGSVLVQDYNNYGTDGDDRDLSDIDRRFANGDLPLLSVIENTDIAIEVGPRGQ